MQFVKVPNMLFSFGLKPIDFMVYCGIKSFCGKNLNVIVKAQKIANRCGIHRNSIKPSVDRLQDLGLLRFVRRTQSNGYRACHLYKLADLSGKWFKLDYKVFSYDLKPSEFMVYAYINCKANHAGRSFPSYKQIIKATGISENTAISSVKTILHYNLLNLNRYTRIINCFGHNNYYMLSVLLRVTGRICKRVIQLLTTSRITLPFTLKYITLISYRISQIILKVKTVFLNRHSFYKKI